MFSLGTRDEMVVWGGGGKTRARKYYLTMTLLEAYAVYKEESGNKCSFSHFANLRPKNVLLLGDTPKDQCKCQVHENVFLKLRALGQPGVDSVKSTFSSVVLCTNNFIIEHGFH